MDNYAELGHYLIIMFPGLCLACWGQLIILKTLRLVGSVENNNRKAFGIWWAIFLFIKHFISWSHVKKKKSLIQQWVKN